ncbi:EsV-1-8 [Ectocarpus siliculosus]|uniref:EsV-1-8 n=1 Tax=Ectocarpus siliculosus TaxID=2880 RepID=D8LNI8_ECTSI|nr:EsV-1-8 [Ectocarpus siliculosus]|eukprot:CBN76269.1 EsV-1-8 [Ectocarpus siliculosus]
MHALFQHGAQVGVRGNQGYTPLHETCWERHEGLEAAVDMLLRWGADETTLNYGGASPADFLGGRYGKVIGHNPAPQDEIDRTRLLLSRAPADRAWRRRGWLVMLRSRDSKAQEGKCRSSGGYDHGDGGEVGGSEMARSEGMAGADYGRPGTTRNGAGGEVEAGGGEEVQDIAAGLLGLRRKSVVHTASNDGCVVGAEGGEEGLRLEVLLLLGLGLEGVFRAVVGFL